MDAGEKFFAQSGELVTGLQVRCRIYRGARGSFGDKKIVSGAEGYFGGEKAF